MKKASYKGIKVDLPDNISISSLKDIVDQCGSDYSITVQGVVDLLSRKLHGKTEENEKLKRLIVSLTPGGSEFIGEPEYCIKYVKEFEADQNRMIVSLIEEKQILRELKNELLEALKICVKLFEENEPNWYLLKHDRQIKEAIKTATE